MILAEESIQLTNTKTEMKHEMNEAYIAWSVDLIKMHLHAFAIENLLPTISCHADQIAGHDIVSPTRRVTWVLPYTSRSDLLYPRDGYIRRQYTSHCHRRNVSTRLTLHMQQYILQHQCSFGSSHALYGIRSKFGRERRNFAPATCCFRCSTLMKNRQTAVTRKIKMSISRIKR